MSSDEHCPGPVLPAIDERLAVPETRYEIVEGRVVYVSPADLPHAMRHSKLAALLEAHTGLEYAVAADMLTRTSERNDYAPDVSVFPAEPDPVTGGRQLEHLAFEVVSTQSLSDAAYKAEQLVLRGVRRVFAIDVEGERALEWSHASGKWEELDPAGEIEDLTLDVALPVKELITTARSDDAVARALYLKGNPYLLERVAEGKAEGLAEGEAKGLAKGKAEGLAEGEAKGLAEGEAKGVAKGKAESLLVVLAMRGFVLHEATRARLLAERDVERLDRWFAQAMTCATIDELDLEV